MWRPSNWRNPYKTKEDCFGYQEVEPAMHDAYEEGANAILESYLDSDQFCEDACIYCSEEGWSPP